MLRIAGGEPLSARQEDVRITGHAIECRINAEDPFRDFMPAPGPVNELEVPGGDQVRFDTLLYAGYEVPPFYDSLLGKLIVHGKDREDCLVRLREALGALKISGIPTTVPLHQALAADADVVASRYHTRFLEHWLEDAFASAQGRREMAR